MEELISSLNLGDIVHTAVRVHSDKHEQLPEMNKLPFNYVSMMHSAYMHTIQYNTMNLYRKLIALR